MVEKLNRYIFYRKGAAAVIKGIVFLEINLLAMKAVFNAMSAVVIVLLLSCFAKKGPPPHKIFLTTLDSLQVSWRSSSDGNWKIVFSGITLYQYYENIPNDTSLVFISTNNVNPAVSSYSSSNTDGSYIILYRSGQTNYDMDYKINYLSDTAMELESQHKTMGFVKKSHHLLL